MSKHFKNQASKRRRDGFQHRSKSCMKRLVSQLFQQSEDYARLKIDNSLLYGKVVKLNQLLVDERKSALREIQKTEAIHDGIVTGPGVLDMKGGLVIAIFVLKALEAAGYREYPVRVVFVGDEEQGHRQSDVGKRLPSFIHGAFAALNFESSNLK